MSRSWSGGSTTRWRKLRKRILEANQHENAGCCQLAIPDICTGKADCVHHVRGKAYGDRVVDLIAACSACNGHVGNPAKISPEPTPRSKW
jgi:hypothetical protein